MDKTTFLIKTDFHSEFPPINIKQRYTNLNLFSFSPKKDQTKALKFRETTLDTQYNQKSFNKSREIPLQLKSESQNPKTLRPLTCYKQSTQIFFDSRYSIFSPKAEAPNPKHQKSNSIS